jgi:NAD-dependent dihydropyrimidine dehydrogenase PreA subunit
MQGLRYIEDAVTLELDADKCTGCRVCTFVCPHGVFAMRDKRAEIIDRGACMECGACALNCAWGAITVKPGVGCAEAIIHSWIYGGEPTCGCSTVPGAASSCCAPVPAAAEEPLAHRNEPGGDACGCGEPEASVCQEIAGVGQPRSSL